MNITIKAGEREVAATLQDSAAARDFLSLLPLTLVLEDYGDTEKISPLPGKLSAAGAPSVGKPFRGPSPTTPHGAIYAFSGRISDRPAAWSFWGAWTGMA